MTGARFLLPLGGLCLLSGIAAALLTAAPVRASSMEDAVRLALEHSPEIGDVASNRDAIQEELRQARGLYLPQIDVAGGIGKERTNNLTTRSNINDGGSLTLTRQESSITLQQRLFDGFESDSSVAREKSRVRSAALRVFENAEFTGLDAIGAYLEVLRQRELIFLAEENVKVHQVILGFLQEQLEGGAGSAADVAQAEARLSRSRATRSQQYNELRDSEAAYARIVGQYPDDVERMPSPATALPPDLEAAVDEVRRNNPSYLIFNADVKTAEAEVSLAESPLYPAVTLEGESEYNDNVSGIEGHEYNHQIMMRLRWNIFRGGIDAANRREALHRVSQSKEVRRRALLQAEEEMRNSWHALEASRKQIEEYSDNVTYSTETRDSYRLQFEVGERTLLDVLDSENELFVAKGQLVTAEINERLASYRILALAGQLLSTLAIEPPEQAKLEIPSFGAQIFE